MYNIENKLNCDGLRCHKGELLLEKFLHHKENVDCACFL
jgi:hypothetical protein